MGFLVHYNVTPILQRKIGCLYKKNGANYSDKRYKNTNVSCVPVLHDLCESLAFTFT